MNLRPLCLMASGALLLAGATYAQGPAVPDPGAVAAADPPAVTAVDTQAVAAAVAPAASLPTRDPFWPVGYVPRRPEKPVAAAPARHSAVPAAPTPAVTPVVNPVDWDEALSRL